MKIAVIGASGNTGRVVADLALNHGHDLRAVVRNPAACDDLAARGTDVVAADLDKGDKLFKALENADAVYYCSPLPAGVEQPFTVERTRAERVVAAARDAGVGHVVLLSAMGPQTAPGVDLIESKRAIEAELAGSGLGYTILRPSMFMDNVAMAGPEALLGVGLTWPFAQNALIQPIAAADIGAVAFRAIVTGPRNDHFDLVGPEALTISQMAETLGRVLGAEVRAIEISDDIFVEHVGPAVGSSEVARAIAGAYRLWESDGSGTGDASIIEREFGVSLTAFRDFAAGLAETWRADSRI